jgi:biopolymer transport protein ExbD
MKIPAFGATRKAKINMTPMIDVVFLLIIFFLVSSHLAKQDVRMKLTLPVAQSGQDDVSRDQRITVNVSESGEIRIGGRAVQVSELNERLADIRQSHGEDIEIRIRGSRDTAYGNVEPIMKACTANQIWNVNYAVYRNKN